jgi:Winged helix-turn-helix transcription repressor, HrcA DNA-binding
MRPLALIAIMKLNKVSNRQIARSLKVDEGTIRNDLRMLKSIAEYSAHGHAIPADEQALVDRAAEYSAAFPLAPPRRPRPTRLERMQGLWRNASLEEQPTILAWMQATIRSRHGGADAAADDGDPEAPEA